MKIKKETLYLLSAMPFALITRLLRPLVRIRFGKIWVERIGHFALEPELYLCERALNMHPPRTLDFFYYWTQNEQYPVRFCNAAMAEMISNSFKIHPFIRFMHAASQKLPKKKLHEVQIPATAHHSRNILLEKATPQLSITKKIQDRGQAFLNELGIKDAPFICVHNRDSAYLKAVFKGMDWAYHDYRDSHIESFMPAMEEFAQRGYYVLRMGAITDKPLGVKKKRIIDYASHYREEALDIFLLSRCKFFIGTDSGLCSLPAIFRRPQVMTNFIPLQYAQGLPPSVLIVPKLLQERSSKSFVSFQDIFQRGYHSYFRSEEYSDADLEVIENSPEDILHAALEMEDRLEKNWVEQKTDKELIEGFWACFKNPYVDFSLLPKVSIHMLRKHSNLIPLQASLCATSEKKKLFHL